MNVNYIGTQSFIPTFSHSLSLNHDWLNQTWPQIILIYIQYRIFLLGIHIKLSSILNPSKSLTLIAVVFLSTRTEEAQLTKI